MLRAQALAWWHVVELGAQILVLVLSPSSYTVARARSVMLHLHAATAPLLPWFLALMGHLAAKGLAREKVKASEMEFGYQVDVRYHGQGLRLSVDVDLKRLEKEGLDAIRRPFDAEKLHAFLSAGLPPALAADPSGAPVAADRRDSPDPRPSGPRRSPAGGCGSWRSRSQIRCC